jgi:hypothetical protein
VGGENRGKIRVNLRSDSPISEKPTHPEWPADLLLQNRDSMREVVVPTQTDWRLLPVVELLRKQNWSAYKYLGDLVSAGCDPYELLTLIYLLRQSKGHLLGDWRLDFGKKRKIDLQRIVNRMNRMADTVDALNGSRAGWFLHTAMKSEPDLLILPHLLRKYAMRLQGAVSFSGPKKRFARSKILRDLIKYVEKATNDSHDEEVTTLVAYAERNPDYDIAAHKKWRQRHP